MKNKAIIIARAIWIYLALACLWSLITGGPTFTRPFHPLNLLANISGVFGATLVWNRKSICQLVAGASGIVVSLVWGIQSGLLAYWANSVPNGEITFVCGSIEFGGMFAPLMIFGPLGLLLISSAIIFWKSMAALDKSLGLPAPLQMKSDRAEQVVDGKPPEAPQPHH